MTAGTQATAAETRTPSRGGAGLLIQIACLLFTAVVVFADVGYAVWDAGLEPHAGALDATFEPWPAGGGFARVTAVDPGDVMAREGVAAGDRVAFDRPYDYFRYLRAGEPVAFTLDHAGHASRHRIAAPVRKPGERSAMLLQVIYDISNIVGVLFGAFILWRSRGQTTLLLLGMALVTFGTTWSIPPFWLSAPAIYPVALAITKFNTGFTIPVLFYAFALRFYEACVGVARRRDRALFAVYTLAQLVVGVAGAVAYSNAIVFPWIGAGKTAIGVTSDVGLLICVGYMFLGWRTSSAAARQRYALMLIGIAAMAASQIVSEFLSPGAFRASDTAEFVASSILGGVVGPALLAYGILRHRVFDLGFAVNRTLVYGVVSAILLGAFGLIEWAVDHFVPIEGREKNALIDAAIAVGVFLTFHRVRDWVEHVIESLFFRGWQQAEAALRKFAKEAPFFTEAPALTRAFVPALSAYAEGAPAAVYLTDGSGFLLAVNNGLDVPARLDPDLRVLVSLRAEPKAAELNDGALNAALIAPMVNRNEVIGLALLGAKPTGHSFRPDEIELIGWATHQVGLDLHALKAIELEAEQARQAEQITMLRTEVATLRSVIPQRA